MTEHSLDFFLDAIDQFKKEYQERIKALGIKYFNPSVGWDETGNNYVLMVMIICKEEVIERVKTLLPEEYKNYKVEFYFTKIE